MAKHEKKGLTAWDAVYYLSDGVSPMAKSDLELWFGGTAWVNVEYDTNFHRSLLGRLRKETWYETGYCLPRKLPSKREPIPADVWCAPTFNPRAGTVSGGGLKFVGVRFHEAETAAPDPSAGAVTKCRKWLVELMMDRRTKTVPQLQDEAGQFGVSGAGFKRALRHAKEQSTTHESWHRPGPTGSS